MKKLFTLLLAVVMMLQMVLPVCAEGMESTAAPTEQASEPTAEPTVEPTLEEPTQPSTEAPTQTPTEAATEPAAEETPAETAAPTAAPAVFRVSFRCAVEGLTLVVYPASGDVDDALTPEEDGAYFLTPGDYAYLAAAEGYAPTEGFFTVAQEDCTVEVSLSPAEQPEGDTLEAKTVESGTCGENLTWTLSDDGVLKISGTGAVTFGPWQDTFYQAKFSKIELASGVTSIEENAFIYCSNLTNVTIPESVTSIGDRAFYGCTGLTNVAIPESVTSIGDGAFYGCTGLTNVAIPGSVTGIGYRAFYGCSSLTNVTILEGVTSIDSSAFNGCTGLTSVTIPGTVTAIGDEAFEYCTALKDIYFGGTEVALKKMYSSFFSSADVTLHCASIDGGTCGKNLAWTLSNDYVLTISGTGTMQDYSSSDTSPWDTYRSRISTVILSPGVTSIGAYAFYGCSSLTSVTIPEGVTSVGNNAFYGCSSLTSVTIPEGVTSIGNNAFYGCSSLTSVTVPEGVTSIGNNAFYFCRGLTSVTIPETVTEIGSCAFEYCTALKDVYFSGPADALRKLYSFPSEVTVHGTRIDAGSCGDDLTWTLSNEGVLTISGTGEMTNYTSKYVNSTYVPETPWYSYRKQITEIVLAPDMTTVGDYAFYGCSNVTSVTVPENVVKIGLRAFSDCSSLRNVTIPESVASFGAFAFAGCVGLSDVTLPEKVTQIDNYVFSDCSGLTIVTIPEGITRIGQGAFQNCVNLSSVRIPATVTGIGFDAFYNCTSLSEVYFNGPMNTLKGMYSFPDNVAIYGTSIAAGECGNSLRWVLSNEGVLTISGTGAMGNYSKRNTAPWYSCREQITTAVLTSGVTSVGNNAFYDCTSLTGVTIPEGVTSIGESAFENCTSLQKVHFNGPVMKLESMYSFQSGVTIYGTSIGVGECGENLTWLLDNEGVLTISGIGAMANYGSNGAPWSEHREQVTKVVLESGVTTVGERALQECSNLTSVTLAQSVTGIGNYAFYGCTGLTGVTIPEGVTAVGDHAFHGCTGLTSVTIPEGVTSIGSYAFYGCTGLASVTVPATVTSMGYYTFDNCTALKDIYFGGSAGAFKRMCSVPDGVTLHAASVDNGTCGKNLTWVLSHEGVLTISGSGDMAAYRVYPYSSLGDIAETPWENYREQIAEVILGSGVSSICNAAFGASTNLVRVTIPESVTSIGYSAFQNCGKLTGVTLPEGLTTIGANAFYHCDNLTGVTIPETVTSIGDSAFQNCVGLVEAAILGGNIGKSAFQDCSALTGVAISEGVTSIGDSAFSGCSSLTSVTIPESVTSIGDFAFSDCSSLTSVTIPESVTSIGDSVFSGCNSLTSVIIPRSVATIGTKAFYGCRNLTCITFAHTKRDELTIGTDAFYLYSNSGSSKPITTMVYVPNVKTMHDAIRGYSWYGTYTWNPVRKVTFVGDAAIAMEGLTLATGDGKTEYELGVPVSFVAAVEPVDTTDDFTFAIVPEQSTAEAWISKDGVLTTLSEGTVTVRVTCAQNPEVFGDCTVTILPPTGELTSLTVTTCNDYPGEAELGKPLQMVPVFTPANAADRAVTWSVENGTGTATIDDNGVLTPLTLGTVTVYAAAANGSEGSCTVNIVRYAEDIRIFMNGGETVSQLAVDEEVVLSYSLSPEDTTTTDVEWSVISEGGAAEILDSRYYVSAKRLAGLHPGKIILQATAKDSKQVVATKELTVTEPVHSYALPDGSGSLYYNPETGFITGVDATVQNAIIPARIDGVTITGIAPYAFVNHKSYNSGTVTSVSIPNTVTEIGAYAFYRCTALSTVRFAQGSSLRTIGESAFRSCSALATLNLPQSVEQVGDKALSDMSALKNLTVPGELGRETLGIYNTLDNLTLTGTRVCANQPRARKVTVSSGVTAIEANAFRYNGSLEQVILPDTLEEIGESAFYDCENLRDINLPDSIKTFGENCFGYCSKIQVLDLSRIPDTVTVKETNLTNLVTVPENLIRGTNGQVSLSWSSNRVGDDYSSPTPGYVTTHYGSNDYYLVAQATGQITVTCTDSYTGARGSKVVTIKAGTAIKPADTGYLVSGGKLTLTAWAEPEDRKIEARWELTNGDEAYASITSDGVLTAKTVREARQITVIAKPYDGSEAASKAIWILPKATGMTLELEKEPLGSTLNVDMFRSNTLNLSAKVQPEDALEEVKWSTSAASVAKVDENGVVTLLKPGKAVIKATAADGSKVTAQVTLTVTYMDSSSKLTLTAEAPAQGLQPGQTLQLTLRGTEDIPAENVVFSVPANKAALGSVDDAGIFTAGTMAGTATVTAALRDDPLNRKASLNIKVIPLQAKTLNLTAQLPDETGTVTEQVGEPLLILPAAELTAKYVFSLTADALDYRGETMTPKVKWASSDTTIATVDANGNVTVKPKVNGQCAITATSTDPGKAQARFWISVRDYSPRLEANSLTLNLALLSGVSTEFVESYGNTVENVAVVNDERFAVSLENNVLTLRASDTLAKGSYKLTLRADCANGESYDYPLTVKTVSTLPKVTVKQAAKLNLFYRDSTAPLTVTAAGCNVTDVKLSGTADFNLICVDGVYTLVRTDTDTAKPNTKATLTIGLEGYSQPVTQSLTVSAGVTAPVLKLSAASSTINSALTDDLTTELWLLDSANARVNLEKTDISVLNDAAIVFKNADSFTLTLPAAKTAKLTLLVQAKNWTQSVKLTHTVTVATKLPTLKAASGITLNAYFTQDTGSAAMVLSQKNLSLQDVTFEPVAKEGTAARRESDKLTLDFDPTTNTVQAYMTDPDNGAAAGSYSFRCTGILEDGTQLSGGTLKITVAKTLPKLRLSATSVRLNSALAGDEQATLAADLTGFAGCTLVGFQELDETGCDGLSFADGKLLFTLPDANAKSASYKLTPVVCREGTEQVVTLPTSQTVKVTVYSGPKLSVSLSAKGKLDTLNPDSAVTYTVSKLNNCQGQITGLTLEGQDADKFLAELDATGAKPEIRLTLKDGESYATNVTYKVRFSLTVCGRQVVSGDQSLRVSQSGTKYAASGNLTLYQSQTADFQAKLTMTAPKGAAIASVTLDAKTPKAFLDAIGGEDGFTVDDCGDTALLTFTAAAPGKLKPGSYTVLLDVLPEGNAENVKPTTVKLTVKVKK